VAKVRELQKTISADKDWRWANNQETLGELEKASANLDSQVAELNVSAVLQQNQRNLSKMVGKERLTVMLQSFCKISKNVDILEEVHARILRMHNAK